MHTEKLPYGGGGGGIWEPIELRELKKQLANVHCGCSFCETYREISGQSLKCQRPAEELYKDQEVQSEHGEKPAKPVVVVVSNQTITEDSYLSETKPPSSLFSKDQVCPTCAFTLNLFRSGTTKIVKDEESEANPKLSSSEKASGIVVELLDKTTSYCKPLLKYPLPNTISAVSSVDSAGSQNRSLREVTFAFNDKFYGDDDLNVSSVKTSQEKTTADNCEEEEETESTSGEVESEESSEDEILRPRKKHVGVRATGIDINKYINLIRPPGLPEFNTNNVEELNSPNNKSSL